MVASNTIAVPERVLANGAIQLVVAGDTVKTAQLRHLLRPQLHQLQVVVRHLMEKHVNSPLRMVASNTIAAPERVPANGAIQLVVAVDTVKTAQLRPQL